jgi:GDA1/CD39 (nucleoside phosphatase) family
MKHDLEADDSWALHMDRKKEQRRRILLNKDHDDGGYKLEKEKEHDYWKEVARAKEEQAQQQQEEADEFSQQIQDLYKDPGITRGMIHGMMIDAGSGGSRIHVYEWQPRILESDEDIEAAVSGRKLSYPGTESRWTDRIEPGIDTFAYLSDQDITAAIANYLAQFLDFAKSILHEEQDRFNEFPIFWRATGGMRIVDTKNRARVVQVVRNLLSDDTYCPFYFVNEQARVISGYVIMF